MGAARKHEGSFEKTAYGHTVWVPAGFVVCPGCAGEGWEEVLSLGWQGTAHVEQCGDCEGSGVVSEGKAKEICE